MSYFIQRRRHIKVRKGDFTEVHWPESATITARLGPADLFGPAPPQPRSVLIHDSKDNSIYWDANIGRKEPYSTTFLEPLSVEMKNHGMSLTMKGNDITATFQAENLDHVSTVLDLIELQVPAYLSVTNVVNITVERLFGTIGSDIEVTFELSEMRLPIPLTNMEARQDACREALELGTLTSPAISRLLVACFYYQQARRMTSPLESRVPELNASELLVDLVKSLEILLGSSRDEMRQGCKRLGFSQTEIESQIIPIVLARNELDGGHPVGTRLSDEDISVLLEYVERASQNVRVILLRAARLILSGAEPLDPLDRMKSPGKAKLKLLKHMRRYLGDAPLEKESGRVVGG